jgi:serine/threonine protein kinase
MEPRVGNKYRLGRKIGSGSFGEIYLGEFVLLQKMLGLIPFSLADPRGLEIMMHQGYLVKSQLLAMHQGYLLKSQLLAILHMSLRRSMKDLFIGFFQILPVQY